MKHSKNLVMVLGAVALALCALPADGQARTRGSHPGESLDVTGQGVDHGDRADLDPVLYAKLSLGAAPLLGARAPLGAPAGGAGVEVAWQEPRGCRPDRPASPCASHAPPPPPAAPAASAEPAPQYPRKGLMLTGWIMLGANWLISTVVGAAILDLESAGLCSNGCKRLGYLLMVPAAGPFLAMIDAENSHSSRVALLSLGLPQLAGLVMAIIGTVQHVADKGRIAAAGRRAGVSIGRGWNVTAGVSPGAQGPVGMVSFSTLLR